MGYLNRGGPVRALRIPAGTAVIPIPYARFKGFGMIRGGRRGFGQVSYPGEGADEAGCPSGQWNSSLQVCCAPGNGTVPALDDPCSILNSAGYDQEQAAAQQQAIEGSAGNQSAELAALASYTQPQQTAALNCVSNPGLQYTDPWGNLVTCPSEEVDDNGIEVSAYTAEQIASMIAGQFPTGSGLPSNVYSGTTAPGAPAAIVAVSTDPTQSYPLSVALTNKSGGSNTNFNVGDSWQIVVSGPPNAQVSASASQNGTSLGSSPMGTIGSNGQLVITGTMSASQAGTWSETWTVNGQNAGSVAFSVGGGSSSSSGASSGASSSSNTSTSDFLSGSVSVAGTSIPTWAIAAAAVVGVILLVKN